MSRTTKTIQEKMRDAYAALYNELNEAATDDYNEYLWNTYGHVTDHDWTDEKEAAGALRDLIDEAYESFLDPDEVMDLVGIDEELKDYLGI